MTTPGTVCSNCQQLKPKSCFTSAQLKKNTKSRTCTDCITARLENGREPAAAVSKRCYFCKQIKTNAGFSLNQRKKALQGLGSCHECVAAGLWVRPGHEPADEDAPRLCTACGNWKPLDTFSKASLRNNSNELRCIGCVNRGLGVLDRFKRHYDIDSRSLRPVLGLRNRSKSRSASTSSSSSPAKKRKKKRRRKNSSSSKSRSSRSDSSVLCVEVDPGDSVADKFSRNTSSEIEAAKKLVAEQLAKMRSVEPREVRLKEFRALLRQWHPDKNPGKTEVATAVFQFLQKGKVLVS